MRARAKFPIAVLAASLLGLFLLAPGGTVDAQGAATGGWVLYSGRENGVRVVFELDGHKLIPALISVPVACVGGKKPHRLAVKLHMYRRWPITVSKQGRFHEKVERLDAAESDFERLVGKVTPKKIEGTISVNFTEPARIGNERCHSGKSPHGPMEELTFRANRHRHRS